MIRTISGAAMALALVVTPLGRAASDAKPITGGANQKASVEGCAGQTLFDGVWRLMVRDVHSVHRPFSGDPGTPGYAVTLQFRNGSHRTISLANSGISGNGTGVELVTADGNTLDLDAGDFQKAVFRPIPQGGSYTTQFHFYFPGGTSDSAELSKPDKFLLQVDPHAGLLRDVGLRYPISDPSFRVRLSCAK